MALTSDTHAWLLPYFATLSLRQPSFSGLPAALRFSALCDAVAHDHPTKAVQMREWSIAEQEAALERLRSVYVGHRRGGAAVLWVVSRRSREFRCVVSYNPMGIHL